MTGSTISNRVTISVALGTGSYPSPLTITSTGSIDPSAADGAAGLVATVSAGYVLNNGAIAGAYGSSATSGGYGGTGGIGVDLRGGSLTNKGRITGGSGGKDSSGLIDGYGGSGVSVTSASLTNGGTITGGRFGGSGVDVTSGTLTNNGTIQGGIGGYYIDIIDISRVHSPGGSGVQVTNSTLTNNGVILGGLQASVGSASGGIGVVVTSGNVTNNSTIAGGSGGIDGVGGSGGIGVQLTNGSLTNSGTLTGGSGLQRGASGGSGADVASGDLTNEGTIVGGSGGEGDVGAAGVVVASGTMTNDGTIVGGSGGVADDYGAAAFHNGGAGGSGAVATGSILTNTGAITGGRGGDGGFDFDHAGSGGSGVSIAAGSILMNKGGITGGTGGFVHGPNPFSAGSGDGVDAANSILTNDGTIVGGYNHDFLPGTGVNAAYSVLTNNGTIAGGSSKGFYFFSGTGIDIRSSVLTNNGTITAGSASFGRSGIATRLTNSILINNGTIAGAVGRYENGACVDATGSFLTNNGTILGGADSYDTFGGVGVLFHGGATLTDAGFIGGGSGTRGAANAVVFGSGASRLILEPGASFSGSVVADAAFSNVLELASAAGKGTIASVGDSFIGFAQIAVDANAAWILVGGNTIASGATLTVLDGASVTDTGALANDGAIALDPSTLTTGSLIGTGSVTIDAGSTLDVQATVSSKETISFAGSEAYLHFDTPGDVAGNVSNFDVGETIDLKGVDPASVAFQGGQLSFTGGSFSLALASTHEVTATASADGAAVALLCFCADTLIQTPVGQRRVQDLAIGDDVTTLSGAKRRIVWIGTGTVPATRGRRTVATPVIVRKDALADNIPDRDLRLTKGHALFLEGALIPVEYLVNHRTIEWDECTRKVKLYHIELATHDVLIANGVPAESYRDDSNRWLFRNANSGWDAVPKEPFAPVLTGGPVVDRVWRQLLERAGLRPGVSLTHDPDLHLEVDGRRVDAASRHGEAFVFTLTGSPRKVRVVSRAAAPDVLGVARDPRVLGIALRQIVLRQGARFQTIKAPDARLAEGFHAFEPEKGWRWTDGDAAMPGSMLERLVGPNELVLHVGCTSTYPIGAEARSAA